ncbi:MAG: adenylate/guanylate cyclase domain-containing protein [Candidatus Rokubacteria bacterium]|nr:adenylate/guanylate cyclase domain-containing protein [Candidatus Rokubacteria bacterium]
MECPRCHADGLPGARFCADCGARLFPACIACGSDLPLSARFCPSCGQPVVAGTITSATPAGPQAYTPRYLAERILNSRASLEGERKQVTVLFADLRSSMELLAGRDPEEARGLLDPILERMIDAVHHYEGTVNQVLGDGIMALFGAPLAHEDHALRACYAAIHMQASVRDYVEQTAGGLSAPFRIRVGLNSGQVVVRTIGNDLHMDYSAVGQTTHLAARMEQQAEPGTTLLAGSTARLVEGHVALKPLGLTAVKGLTEPIETS